MCIRWSDTISDYTQNNLVPRGEPDILSWVLLVLCGIVFESVIIYTYHVPLHRKRLRRIVSGLFPEVEASVLDELLPNKCSLETLR